MKFQDYIIVKNYQISKKIVQNLNKKFDFLTSTGKFPKKSESKFFENSES